MAKKKVSKDSIQFTGESANDVTGSQYYIQFGKWKCLLECGLHQSSSNSYLDSYRINSEKFKFKPSEIDYVFVAHPHIDHCGLIPRLVREGFNGRIIATQNTFIVMRALLRNSCYIVREEAEILSKRYKRKYKPLYEEKDVDKALSLVRVYNDYGCLYTLNEGIKFQWFTNSHCIGAAQLQLVLSDGMKTRKVLYTSDLGALNSRNYYVQNTEIPEMYNDIVIMESTYGAKRKNVDVRRDYDIEHLESAIDTTLERGGCVVMPCFSFSRTQELLTTLYDIYGSDGQFDADVVVDSVLSCEICSLYRQMLDGEDLEKWESVMEWRNLRLISDKEDSARCLQDEKPKVILSSSGFCTNGRIINYLKKYLRDANSTIVFSGFAGDNDSYLSYRIKHFRKSEFISVNRERIPNKADCITLSSFSSHANQSDLVEFGSSLNTSKVILVHGSEESKRNLSELLADAISNKGKLYRVITSTKGMIAYL